MSRKKDNTTAYVILAVAAFLMLNKRQQPPQFQNYPTAPPPPPRSNAQSWAMWVNAIVSLYGITASLWQPGGPFHQFQTSEIYDTINQNPVPDYNNPYLNNTGGWA
jgi:hypothetical protein